MLLARRWALVGGELSARVGNASLPLATRRESFMTYRRRPPRDGCAAAVSRMRRCGVACAAAADAPESFDMGTERGFKLLRRGYGVGPSAARHSWRTARPAATASQTSLEAPCLTRQRSCTRARAAAPPPLPQVCAASGCRRRPSYNYDGRRAAYCHKHKAEGMTNQVSRRCAFAGCTRQPMPSRAAVKCQFCRHHAAGNGAPGTGSCRLYCTLYCPARGSSSGPGGLWGLSRQRLSQPLGAAVANAPKAAPAWDERGMFAGGGAAASAAAASAQLAWCTSGGGGGGIGGGSGGGSGDGSGGGSGGGGGSSKEFGEQATAMYTFDRHSFLHGLSAHMHMVPKRSAASPAAASGSSCANAAVGGGAPLLLGQSVVMLCSGGGSDGGGAAPLALAAAGGGHGGATAMLADVEGRTTAALLAPAAASQVAATRYRLLSAHNLRMLSRHSRAKHDIPLARGASRTPPHLTAPVR
ncbi:hypothetical protein JKP88DRAFT_242478 [Tribonema minus]|uniref:Uncharacterized protein n=1 Tax=Tribonema minus TaxID=303371 RepID=A0A836C8S2_9STRA|nr:hypothetical protein JKP88DRAFT_242478 [Tribonema minus]